MMDKLGDFILAFIGVCVFSVLLVMVLVLFGLAVSFFFALLPYVILGFFGAWVLKALTS